VVAEEHRVASTRNVLAAARTATRARLRRISGSLRDMAAAFGDEDGHGSAAEGDSATEAAGATEGRATFNPTLRVKRSTMLVRSASRGNLMTIAPLQSRRGVPGAAVSMAGAGGGAARARGPPPLMASEFGGPGARSLNKAAAKGGARRVQVVKSPRAAASPHGSPATPSRAASSSRGKRFTFGAFGDGSGSGSDGEGVDARPAAAPAPSGHVPDRRSGGFQPLGGGSGGGGGGGGGGPDPKRLSGGRTGATAAGGGASAQARSLAAFRGAGAVRR
jgi:hypothetical protein